MNNLPIDVAVPDPEPADERAAFQTEFDKLGYQWSESNQAKAFLGWQMARRMQMPTLSDEAKAWVGRWLVSDMDQAVQNGANSVSMPDQLVEIAAWLDEMAPKAAPAVAQVPLEWRDWVEGVRDDILYPLAHRENDELSHIAEGLGQRIPNLLEMSAPEAPAQRCPYCDDTGDVHTPTGEWRGRCTCPAGTEAPAQADNWQQYAKDGETAQDVIERERKDNHALLSLLAKARSGGAALWTLNEVRQYAVNNRCDGDSDFAGGVAAANGNIVKFIDYLIEQQPAAPAQAAQSAGEVEGKKINLSTYAWGVSRMGDNPKAVLVSFRSEPSDDDLRTLHEALRPSSGRVIWADAALSHKEPQR